MEKFGKIQQMPTEVVFSVGMDECRGIGFAKKIAFRFLSLSSLLAMSATSLSVDVEFTSLYGRFTNTSSSYW